MKKIVSFVLASLIVGLVSASGATPAAAQVYGSYCCDAGGNRRCVITPAGPVGAACWCNGQGAGYICL